MIKKYNEFINEGLFGAFKARNQIIKLQGLVVDEYERLLQEKPKHFQDGKSVLKAVERFAYSTYKKVVTSDLALTFSQWWEIFSKAQIQMLDGTVFIKPNRSNDKDDEIVQDIANHFTDKFLKTNEQFSRSADLNRLETTVEAAADELVEYVLDDIYWDFLKNATDLNECDDDDITFIISLANNDKYLLEDLDEPFSIAEIIQKKKHINYIDIIDQWVEENWEDYLQEETVDALYDFFDIGGTLGKNELGGGRYESFRGFQMLVTNKVINKIKESLLAVKEAAAVPNIPEIVYTPEEYKTAYDIISEYYDGDVDEFLYSTNIEEKVDFIITNEIETLRACEVCGKFINEGYIYDDITVFCSDECAISYLGKARFEHTHEDVLYWTAWEG